MAGGIRAHPPLAARVPDRAEKHPGQIEEALQLVAAGAGGGALGIPVSVPSPLHDLNAGLGHGSHKPRKTIPRCHGADSKAAG